MSAGLRTPGLLHCDGTSRFSCSAMFSTSTLRSARETRAEARQEGWRTNLPNPGKRRRLDECPDCRKKSHR